MAIQHICVCCFTNAGTALPQDICFEQILTCLRRRSSNTARKVDTPAAAPTATAGKKSADLLPWWTFRA